MTAGNFLPLFPLLTALCVVSASLSFSCRLAVVLCYRIYLSLSMAFDNSFNVSAQLAEQRTNLDWALNSVAYDVPMFSSYDQDAESDRAYSPPSLLQDVSPTSSTSPLALDPSTAGSPPGSEYGMPRIVDPERMMPFGRDDGMHIDHVSAVPQEPAFTLDSLGLYGHIAPAERGALVIVPKSEQRVAGPERTTKTTKRARLNSVTNQSTKGPTRRGKAKAKAESAPARIRCEDCGHSYKSAVMLREHATFALTHDNLKTDDELPPVRWVCPRHGTPYTVPTSLQRHLSSHDACETALAAWCQRVGITRGQYLSLNYNKDFCSTIKFKPRTDPKWQRRMDVTRKRGGMKDAADAAA